MIIEPPLLSPVLKVNVVMRKDTRAIFTPTSTSGVYSAIESLTKKPPTKESYPQNSTQFTAAADPKAEMYANLRPYAARQAYFTHNRGLAVFIDGKSIIDSLF